MMETGSEISEEVTKSRGISDRVGEAVRGVLHHVVDSRMVEEKWDKAHEHIVAGLDAGKVREALETHREDWHRLAHALNITATTLDGTLMAIFGGWSINTIRLAGHPWQMSSSENINTHFRGRWSRWSKGIVKQMPYIGGLLGIAAGVGALRPARRALEAAGSLAGIAGAPVARIVDRIVGRPPADNPKEPPVVWYGSARRDV